MSVNKLKWFFGAVTGVVWWGGESRADGRAASFAARWPEGRRLGVKGGICPGTTTPPLFNAAPYYHIHGSYYMSLSSVPGNCALDRRDLMITNTPGRS
ncbi:hypothetical protein LSTR_LSTR017519 [Laodelphax striatellus]|uniref:Uncharacterized protein n=1 Tax=Laodelphax striatellus TaxID=195883 RepID=A0A482XNS2_LAOST|nr:hypothetical protein LSTR_LSTR012270 [Laodelphax striatellus]RZF47522.1 hypothetical protein LSTR_LSTR017519 [Laodelphax striatellus]